MQERPGHREQEEEGDDRRARQEEVRQRSRGGVEGLAGHGAGGRGPRLAAAGGL